MDSRQAVIFPFLNALGALARMRTLDHLRLANRTNTWDRELRAKSGLDQGRACAWDLANLDFAGTVVDGLLILKSSPAISFVRSLAMKVDPLLAACLYLMSLSLLQEGTKSAR